MIYSITGTVKDIEPNLIVVENNGICYAVKTSITNITSGDVTLYTYLHVKEDILDLYGFLTKEELKSFKLLISISGVGPKAAISILSSLTPEELALAIASNDSKALTKAQGIGSKTAQRIVLELKDKIGKIDTINQNMSQSVTASVKTGNKAEAISALCVLGYSATEASQAVSSLDDAICVEDMIRQGLKNLSQR